MAEKQIKKGFMGMDDYAKQSYKPQVLDLFEYFSKKMDLNSGYL